MASEDDIIAVFRADIDQYKAQLAEHVNVTKQASKATDDLTNSTTNFSNKSKSSASSIKTLSQGIGGLTGLLAVSGRLIGFNTSQLQDLIFTSQQFVQVGRNIINAQKLANEATKASVAAKGADIAATTAQTVATGLSSAGISLLITGIIAASGALYAYISSKHDDVTVTKEMIKLQQDLNDLHNEATKISLDAAVANLENQAAIIKAGGEATVNQAEKVAVAEYKILLEKNKQTQIAIEDANREKLKAQQVFDENIRRLLVKPERFTDEEKLQAKVTFQKKQNEIDSLLQLQAGYNAQINVLDQDLVDKTKKILEAEEELRKRQLQKEFDAFVRFHDLEDEKIRKKEKARSEALSVIDKNELDLKILALQKQRDEILKNDRITANERLLIEADFQNKINILIKENRDKQEKDAQDNIKKDLEKRTLLSKTYLENNFTTQEKFDRDLATLDLLSLQQERARQIKSGEDTIAIEEKIAAKKLEIRKKEKDIRKKNEDEFREDVKTTLQAVGKSYDEAFERRKEQLSQEIDINEQKVEEQRRLAEKGLANTLDIRERELADSRRQQQIEAERNKRIKLLETFLNSLADFSKTDAKSALPKALLQLALATAVSAQFAEEGGVVGEIKEKSFLGRRHRGGGDMLVHAQTGEGILPRDSMNVLGRRNFELLRNVGRHPIREDIFKMPKVEVAGGATVSNQDVVKELKALQHIIKNKKESEYHIDEFGNYIKKTIENGITDIVKGKLKKPKWRS
ncbi:MAG: hypothetical protein ACHQ1D_00280 [Nitrososphaerales archaeon]